jgi:hypothetical protein
MTQDRTFPFFVFVRDLDAEREGGFVLAGRVVFDLPKDTPPQRVEFETDYVIREVLSRETDSLIAWPKGSKGEKPANAVDVDDDALMGAWAQDRLTVAIRVDPRAPGDHLRLDRKLLNEPLPEPLPGLGGRPWKQ